MYNMPRSHGLLGTSGRLEKIVGGAAAEAQETMRHGERVRLLRNGGLGYSVRARERITAQRCGLPVFCGSNLYALGVGHDACL